MGVGHALLLVEAGMLEWVIRANRTSKSIFSPSEAGSVAFKSLWVSAVPPNRPMEGSPEKYKREVKDRLSSFFFSSSLYLYHLLLQQPYYVPLSQATLDLPALRYCLNLV